MASFFVGKQPEEILMDLRLAAKQLASQSRRCVIESKKEKDRVKTAVKNKNLEAARIHAENAIRKHHESVSLLRLSTRVETAASKFKTAITMNKVTSSMASIVQEMDRAVSGTNLEQVADVMQRFEGAFEDLDIQEQVMSAAIDGSVASVTPADEVEGLITQVAEEVGIEFELNLGASTLSQEDRGELEARLKLIRETAEKEDLQLQQQQQQQQHQEEGEERLLEAAS